MMHIISLVIAIALIVAEYLLSSKLKSPIWGGIIPFIIIIGAGVIYGCGYAKFEWNNVFPLIVVICVFLSDWEKGREQYKKNKQAELDKMKARDIG